MDRRIDPRGTAKVLFEEFHGAVQGDFLEDLLSNIETAQEAGRSLVYLAHEVASLARGLEVKEREALTLLLLSALLAMAQGSSRLPADVTGELWHTLLATLLRNAPGGWTEALARERITRLLDDPRLAPVLSQEAAAYKPLLYLDGHIYPQRMLRLEESVAGALQALLARGASAYQSTALEQAAAEVFSPDEPGRSLDPNQQYAVLTAAHMPLAVISGGPGTGKTTIVVAILRLLRRLQPGLSVALAAPTGKAAFRMKESIASGLGQAAAKFPIDAALAEDLPNPATLHRLLGASADGRIFKHNEWNPAPFDVLIVDEASMIDLALMDHLLRAMPPTGKLILLGDADQLPSVDAGAVLRDLVPAGFAAQQPWRAFVKGQIDEDPTSEAHPLAGCAVRLKKTHRQAADADGEAIRALAVMARDGAADALFHAPGVVVPRGFAAEISFAGVEHLAAAAGDEDEDFESQLHDFCDHWFNQHLQAVVALAAEPFALAQDGWTAEARARLEGVFTQHEKRKVLCVSRVLPSGSQQLNRMLHDRFADRVRQRGSTWVAGEPVIMLHNDYEREIFNGDQGVVVRTCNPEGIETQAAVFRRGDRFIPVATAALAGGIDLGYAMTVHKSQGSEFDHVALVLPRQDIPLATREIIYTAVTRAKRSVLLLGQPELLASAIQRSVSRISGLRDRLIAKKAGQ
jgi:exodeoxyribonuclease V alpha subunit